MSVSATVSGAPRRAGVTPFYDEGHPAFSALEKLQVVASSGRPPIWFADEADEWREDNSTIPARSLQWLALALEKSPRTVRRYCELGLVLGARQTKGGHWRVTAGRRILAAVRKAIHDFERHRYTVQIPVPLEVRRMIQASQKNLPPRFDYAALKKPLRAKAILRTWDYLCRANGYDPDAMAAGRYGKDVQVDLSQRAVGAVRDLAERRPFDLLAATAVAAIRRRQGWRITRQNIARELGVSRSSLYRNISKEDIRRIIDAE
jgi:hypothetical protein